VPERAVPNMEKEIEAIKNKRKMETESKGKAITKNEKKNKFIPG
jgi:hypothetical protein